MVIARSLRGMVDLFESDLEVFRAIEKSIDKVCHDFGYREIRTPILEDIALFKRSIGEDSDIVEKEMFLVEDGEHTYCLRPENTAAVVRALIERGGINEDTEEKLYYFGPMFRKERPQKARLRQFHQFGIELFGISAPVADIEVIAMVNQLFNVLNLTGVALKINTLGISEERSHYKSALHDFLSNHINELCEDCKRRFKNNPLRVLDCKNQRCKEIAKMAPKVLSSLGKESRMHFDEVQAGLEQQGISFEVDQNLVRGLDYYNRTVFEFLATTGLGAQNAVAAGGRYDGLFLTLGNKIDLPAIGCAGGIERVALLLKEGALKSELTLAKITLIGADDQGMKKVTDLGFRLRKLGIAADFSLQKKSTKAQMRRANKLNASYVIVVGEEEIKQNRVIAKSLTSDEKTELSLDENIIANFLTKTS